MTIAESRVSVGVRVRTFRASMPEVARVLEDTFQAVNDRMQMFDPDVSRVSAAHVYSDGSVEETGESAPLFGSRRFKPLSHTPAAVHITALGLLVFVGGIMATFLLGSFKDILHVPSEMGIDSIEQCVELSLEEFVSMVSIVILFLNSRQQCKRAWA